MLALSLDEGRTPMLATLTAGADLQVSLARAPDNRPSLPVAIDATGLFQFKPDARDTRAIVTLSFDRVVRELLGPPAGAMPH